MATISPSDLMVALVQAASTLPAFILSVFAGAMADNLSRRTVLLVGRSMIAAASTIFTILMGFGFVDPGIILGVTFLIGCGVALNDPAWQASVGDIVDRRDIPAAVTLINVGFNTVRSVGPALGGIVVASFGPLLALALSTISYLVPLATIWHMRWPVRSLPLPREPMSTAIYDGTRFTAMSSQIKAALARGTLLGLAGIATLALLPLVVRDQLNGGPLTYGILMAGFGAGAFVGGLSAGFINRLLSQEMLIRAACLACAACAFALASSSSVFLATTALAAGGVGWVTAWSRLGVCVQLASPRWIVGRTISIYFAFTYGGIAAGSWLWGAVAESYSLTSALAGSAGALVLVAGTGILLPVLEQEEADLEPVEVYQAPAIALDLKARSGPIAVKIEYEVLEQNTQAFLTLMQERRRAQSRVGARHWTIQRDLQEPRLWTETFRTPTWTEFLRLNHRLTTADRELEQQLGRVHAGEVPPRIRLSIERPTGLDRKGDQLTPLVTRI